MKLLVVTIAPLFPDQVQGGSQRVLMQVLPALGERCEQVRVLCGRSAGTARRFKAGHNVAIWSELPLRGAFPSPFEVPPYALAAAWRLLREGAQWADRTYLHGDGMFLRNALGDKPVIRSLHDFVYEEALVSSFQFPAALTIAPSRYVRDCLRAVVGPLRELEEIRVITNGVETSAERPVPRPPPGIEPKRKGDCLLLFPHRLDPRKGTEQALMTLQALKRLRKGVNFRLLIPVPRADQRADDEGGVQDVLDRARALGVAAHVETHDWLATADMPAYYAFGDVTLCLGSIAEAMPLVPLESAAAGTPVVIARTGPWQEMASVPSIGDVAFADVEGAARAVIEATEMPTEQRESGRRAVARCFSLGRMVEEYVDAITGSLPSTPATFIPARVENKAAAYRLAPWCHIEGGRVFNHHQARVVDVPDVLRDLLNADEGALFAASQLTGRGIRRGDIEQLVAEGVLVCAI